MSTTTILLLLVGFLLEFGAGYGLRVWHERKGVTSGPCLACSGIGVALRHSDTCGGR